MFRLLGCSFIFILTTKTVSKWVLLQQDFKREYITISLVPHDVTLLLLVAQFVSQTFFTFLLPILQILTAFVRTDR